MTIKACRIVAASLVLLTSCKKPQPVDIPAPPPATPPYSWKTATLESQNIDPDTVALAMQEFHATSYVESFVLVRNCFLVQEDYYTSSGIYTTASIASMTKSFHSAFVGIALREGYLDSLGQKLLGFFPEYVTPSIDPRKWNITVEHLLTMTAGFDYDEGADHSGSFNQNTNWMMQGIWLPLRTNPGQVFNYASIQAHLVGGTLAKSSHMSTMSLGRQFLFQPLKITVSDWPQDPQGYYFAGTGMVLYPRDLARFGDLYVNAGRLDGVEILPSSWVKVSTSPHVTLGSQWGAFTNVNYGYFWWTAQWNADSVFMAVGFGGQFIIGVPAQHLVVVVTSNLNCTNAQSDARMMEILDIVARHVLGAVRG